VGGSLPLHDFVSRWIAWLPGQHDLAITQQLWDVSTCIYRSRGVWSGLTGLCRRFLLVSDVNTPTIDIATCIPS